ncbi:MAG: DUF1489 domain-containing protein [Pseudomonadota bacterium]
MGNNMSGAKLHLLKLSVGSESIDKLHNWQHIRMAENQAAGRGPIYTHVTRMWPRREAELLDGGSIYWIIKGSVSARQRIERLDERIGTDGIRRCAMVLEPKLFRTAPQPRRPFQGWRYLQPQDAPSDLGPYVPGEESLPQELAQELAVLGVL